MIEEWRIYRDFRGCPRGFLWEISNLGRVKKNGSIIELTGSGYYKVNKYYVHRMVAETFIGEIPKGYHVDHIDGNCKNNNANNLRIVTSLENHRNPITRARISNSRKGCNNPAYGKPGTNLGKRWVNNGLINKCIYPDDLPDYYKKGFVLGKI